MSYYQIIVRSDVNLVMKCWCKVKEKSIKLGNLKINYINVGEGRSILILHGWNSSSKAWWKVTKLLAEKGFSVYVPDLPGFGKSYVPKEVWGVDDYVQFVLEFINELKIGNLILLGHSFGGQIAIKLAYVHPQRIEKLILCAPAAIRHKNRLKVFLFYLLAKMGKLVFSLPVLRTVQKKARRVLYFIVREKDYLAAGNLKETFKRVISEDARPYLSKINSETLILWGSNDKMIPVSDADILSSGIANSSVIILKKVGHKFPYETPKVLVRELMPFINK